MIGLRMRCGTLAFRPSLLELTGKEYIARRSGANVPSHRIDSSDESSLGRRRIELAHCSPIDLPPLTIDPPARRLRNNGREVVVEPRMMQVLVALATANGSILSREDLIASCWDGRVVGDEAISSVIYRLRRTLGELAGASVEIETIPKVGFRLIHMEASRPHGSRGPWLFGAGSAALALIGGLVLSGGIPTRFTEGSKEPPSIAVLPFADLSEDGRNAYFANGISEELMGELSKEPHLRVIGRSSAAMIERGSVEEARRRLGVTHVLEGSVRRDGEALRVSVRLVDAKDGSQLWSQEFDRTLGDVFAIQDDIGSQVLSRLRGTFSARPRGRASSTRPEVYDLYLAAMAEERKATKEGIERGRALLEKAVKLDPNYAPAIARLSMLEGIEPELAGRSMAHAKRALELAPDLADAQTAMGAALYSDREWSTAVPYLNRAISLDPGNFVVWQILSELQFQHLCRPRQAVASLRRAVAIEPLSDAPQGALVWILAELGDFAGAKAVIDEHAAVVPRSDKIPALRSLLAQVQGDLSTAMIEAEKAGSRGWYRRMQIYQAFGMTREAAAQVPPGERAGLPPNLSINDPRAAKWAMGFGDDIWLSSWGYLAPGSSALVKAGRSDWLVQSFDRNFKSVDAYDRVLGCKQLPDLAPNLILALRDQGRKRDADHLLRLAVGRYNEARRAGYKSGWDAVAASLLILAGQRDAGLRSLNRAVDRGWLSQGWPWGGLDDPVYDPLRSDPRFKAVLGRIQSRTHQEWSEFAKASKQKSA